MGQKLIRPAGLISWPYPHHNSQYILHCVALTAALPWLYGTQMTGPAGMALVLLFIYPRSNPRVLGQCLAVPRQLQKSLNAAVTRWRPLMCSSEVFLRCQNILNTLGGVCARPFRQQQGMGLQALLEPLLHCARWMHPLGAPSACPAVSCHGLAGQACSPK